MKHLLKLNEEDFENYELPNKSIVVIDFDERNNYVSNSVIKIGGGI
jgi:bisphosphoglycerate-dependent phosphoglycerate mutase